MMISTIARLYQVLTSRTKVLIAVSGMVFLAFALARGQSPANTNEPAPVPIGYSTLQHITSNDSGAVIAEKAAKVLPRPNQTSWMRLERTFFIHFGPNTFRGVEWGSGREDPSVFNPTALDAEQWMRAIKGAGGKMAILVCKHHDGFSLWPTRYSNHSVAASPWRGGKGSVVREVADAARKYGVKLGVYLSPADLYQLRTNPTNPSGYYGDESSIVSSTIPTDPASFKTNPALGRTPPAGFNSYIYSVDDYNRYFLNQLYELLTDFGPIDEVWFDGANPDRQVKETYDYKAWYDLIHHLQPNAVIAVKGPDVRWVGNEEGEGRTTEWSVVPLPTVPDAFTWTDQTAQDLGSRAKLTPGSYLWWYPAEVNEPILNGWFWSANKRPKSASQLIDIYYQSVGRNGNMLLNLSPDTRGLIPDNQLAPLNQMAQVVDGTFAVNLAAGATLTADSSNPAHKPALAMDGNLDTWWEAAPGRTNATLTLTLPGAANFDVVSLQEAVDHRGQRIESFTVEVRNGSGWTTADEQTTVGHKRLLRLKSPVTTSQVRIRITGSRLEPTLAEVGLYKQAVPGPGQSAAQHPEWPGKGQLFVGTCYQPVDRSPEQIRKDIALMKQAGFTMVRMGDLSWDAFEPSEGQFEFAWFDQILEQMDQAAIKVILDIGGSPAPIWLHHKYPSVNFVNEQGATVYPAERYMDDISDPAYREHLIRFADELTRHYAHNPALAAIGYNNEIGNGVMSYSEGDRQRFIEWLKAKYGTIANLNGAWATQRWSRHLNSFDEVQLPYADGPSPPERYLDLRRFWSDVTISVLEDLEIVRQRNVPNLPAVSNLWDTAGRRGFDYLSSYKKYVSYGAEGFYPADPLDVSLGALLIKGDLPTPAWFNEFTTGGGGYYGGPKGIIRMWAYLALIDYGQAFLAWTFNTHRGGEEQALFGLLDHDGTPSWKYAEFKQIATEFSKLQRLGFPRYHKPDVAIAYSFESNIASRPPASNTVRSYFSVSYTDQVESALQPFFEDNIDVAIINIGHSTLDYKLLVVPADYLMDTASADAIRNFVHNGGTVIMTAFSAKVDENNQWFDTPLPGRLSDVFGIRTSEFYRPSTPPEISLNGKTEKANLGFYEVLEPHTAKAMAIFMNTPEKSPAITVNNYGKGRAIYVAVPAQMSVLAPLVRSLYADLAIDKGPETPSGVYVRIVEGRTLYVNTTGEEKTVGIRGSKHGIITGASYEGVIRLKPYDADLVD